MKNPYLVISLCGLLLLLPSCLLQGVVHERSLGDLGLEPAWQTAAVFANPASVVFDPVARILLVANVNGPPMKRDGNGFLSKVAVNGVVLDRKWLTGFDGPKGMALHGNTLYVADITSLAVVDLSSGLITKYPAKGAKFLDGVAIDRQGRVYVSDMYTDAIYVLADDSFDLWLRTRRLASPRGLLVQGDSLYVGSWGVRKCGFQTEEPGHLLRIDLKTKKIHDVGDGSPLANLNGVEGLAERGFLVTDWQQGTLIHLSPEAKVVKRINLGAGAADLEVLPVDWELVVVPLMQDNLLKAFTLPIQ